MQFKKYFSRCIIEDSLSKMDKFDFFYLKRGIIGVFFRSAPENDLNYFNMDKLKNFIPEYIYYVFSAKKKDLVKQAVGGAQPNISQIKIKNTLIPVLPIAEQKCIVAKLDTLSAETRKLETIYQQKLANLEELKKSVLKRAFNGDL